MKNLTAIILTGCIAITSLFAKNTPKPPQEMTNFFYQKGYKEGYSTGYKQGYKDAIKDVLRRLSVYEKKMEAIEAGKYLLQTGQITYPQIYKESTPNGYKIVIIPPKVEGKLSINSLILLPTINSSLCSVIKNKNKINLNADGFFLQNQTNLVNNGVNSVKSINKEISLRFPKNQKVFEILQLTNIPFVENANSYTVYFKNKAEEESFCKNIGGAICKMAY